MSNWKPSPPPFRENKQAVFVEAAKVGEFIYQIGEFPQLRKPSNEVPVKQITSNETKAKIAYLKECLVNYRKLTGRGRGITAVQIGTPERFSVIYTPEQLLIIINPTVTKKSQELFKYPEMCMSANPIIAPTIRPAWIEFEYYDENGNKQYWNTKAETELGRMMNRVFQHEIDHMEGIINIDIVKSPKELILESDPKYYDTATFEKI